MDEPAAAAPADPEQCREPFDKEHLEQLFATVQRVADSDWRTMLEGPGVRVARSDFEPPFIWIRNTVEAEDVPVEVITRFIAVCPTKIVNNFIESVVERAELRPADPGDPDGLGRVVLHDQTSVYFGFQILEQRIYATRRLPNGTGVGIRAPVDFIDGRWTTRKHDEKFIPAVAWRAEVTEKGSRFAMMSKNRPRIDFAPFIPTSILCQILAQMHIKFMLQFRRTHVAKWQAADGVRRAPRLPLFASGSAGPPLHLSTPLFSVAATLESPPSSPFASHAWSRPEAPADDEARDASPRPPAPAPPDPPCCNPNELFFGLIGRGAEPESAATSPASPDLAHSSGGVYQMNSSQKIRKEGYMDTPSFRSVLSEAARASLDLSIYMEALSLGVPPPSPPAAPAVEPAAGSSSQVRARARPRSEAEGSAEGGGERPIWRPQRLPRVAEPQPRRGKSPPPQPRPPRPIRPAVGPAPPWPPLIPLWPGAPGVPALHPTAAGLPAGCFVTYGLVPIVMAPDGVHPPGAIPLVQGPSGC